MYQNHCLLHLLRLGLTILLCSGFATSLVAQSYTSFFTGDTTDIVPANYEAGVLIAGGGPDSDAAMRWLLQRADGGDVLIIRASGSDGYNDYLFEQLGESVNSVETIRFNSAAAATDPYVIRRIREAEALFIAGGDQSVYVEYWRDSPIADALNYLLNDKGVTIGGTSAGMAILGGVYYAPQNQSLISLEALDDPYHPNAEGISNQDFLFATSLANTITDTHFEQRDRQGRSLVFLARAMELVGSSARCISANEASALAITPDGIARAFGEYPSFDDYIFLLAPGCMDNPNTPETMLAGSPIEWQQDGRAVSVYRLPATINGTHTFDLLNWMPITTAGEWQYWTASSGQLTINTNGASPTNCQPSSTTNSTTTSLQIAPQPARDILYLTDARPDLARISISDLNGRVLLNTTSQRQLSVAALPQGVYFLHLEYSGNAGERGSQIEIRKFLKQ